MNRRFLGLLSAVVLFLPGCASMIGGNKTVSIDNKFGPTFFAVTDHKNKIIHQGVTPQQVSLETSRGYILPAKYHVDFIGQNDHTDRYELKANANPWTFANAAFLTFGVIGIGIDGVNGNIYRLPKKIYGHVPNELTVTDSRQGYQMVQDNIIKPQVQAASFSKPAGISSNSASPPNSENNTTSARPLRATKLPPPPKPCG
jgi:hypothetical protein